MNFNRNDIDEYNKMVYVIFGMRSYFYTLQKLDLDLRNCETLPTKPSINVPSIL